MKRLVQAVLDVMGDVFPELKEHSVKIREIIADEEASFGRTLTKVCVLLSVIFFMSSSFYGHWAFHFAASV